MKTTFRFILIALSCVLVFSSCKKLSYHEFNEDDKVWINVLTKGQTLQFVSDTGDIRVYTVTSTSRGYNKEGKNYNAIAEGTVRPVDSLENRYPGGFVAIRNSQGFSFEILWVHHPVRKQIANLSPTTLSAGGVTYNDVYISDISGSVLLDSIDNVETVWYSKSAGFIQFKEYNGQTWVRKN
jgi:hypothetical protein